MLKMCRKTSLGFMLEKEWTELAALVRILLKMSWKYWRRDILPPYLWKKYQFRSQFILWGKETTSAWGALFLCGTSPNRYRSFRCVIWESPEDSIADVFHHILW